jgi:serine/threonine-protein kinase PpkA
MGTPHYMSPEQVEGKPPDARSDLYSLGVLLYEMLSGTLPYRAGTPLAVMYKHVHAPIPALPAPLAMLQPLVARLLAKSPAARCAAAGEVRDALLALQERVPV